MIKKFNTPIAIVLMAILPLVMWSCKSCNKNNSANQSAQSNDSITIVPPQQHSVNLPHADTSLIPVLTKILDEAFDASAKKDYVKLGSYMIYRGGDQKRFGNDIYNAKHSDERALVKMTSDVFNQWNTGIDTRDYPRVFDYSPPGSQPMVVLEVIFVSKKNINRKFFGFMKLKDEYKIADVTSQL